ncbi:hypothetical protein NSK_003364 [Nannochloropsis salina CCMP1776]|uniref:Phosphatidylethanolamine-binding protein n=1 Tax=Nannochloropsis salina CCMP1776 TaxID=1027361 RepID=A0A4D9D7H4_9STRA|nr:hypothetical protein NSK_003364 [Nannochloropsis salina CCMP1776]|eukprot:TFJ85405.1 hypothetical protein NSK_003364 [Nannochloropsis salina CCMP1776]
MVPSALAAPATPAAASLESLKTAHIIPDVISNFDPTATLRVQYGKQAPLEMGEQILPSEAADPPSVTFMGTDPQKLYTLVMTDPGVLDIKTLRGPQQSAWQWLHWIVVNVPGEKAVPAAGQVLQPYGQPAPPAGNHRYTFILFEQKAEINPAVPKGRDAFDTRAFAIANGLTPIGGFYFLAGPETAQ